MSELSSTFAPEFEMSLIMKLGLVATPLAYLNLKRAEKAYEEALEKANELASSYQYAIDAREKDQAYLQQNNVHADWNGNTNAPLQGVRVAFDMYVGNLGGKKMAAMIYVRIRNDSGYNLDIFNIAVDDIVVPDAAVEFTRDTGMGKDHYAGVWGVAKIYNTSDFTSIQNKQSKGFECSPIEGVALLNRDAMKRLRKCIASAGGKKLVTSITKKESVSIPITANIGFTCKRSNKSIAKEIITPLYQNVKGTMIYENESYYPVEL